MTDMFKQDNLTDAASSMDKLVDEGIARLRKTLARDGRRDLNILVDPALADPVMDLCVQYKMPFQRMSVAYGDVSEEVKPYLVTVRDEERDERFVNATVRLAVQESVSARDAWPAARSLSAWIIMDEAETSAFSQGFAAHALLRPVKNSAQKKLLRFWDPRVLPQLARIVGENAWPHWMGVNASWLSIDGWGHMREQRFARPAPAAHEAWLPDERAIQALERVSEVNRCLAMSGVLHLRPDDQVERHFDRLLLLAANLGCARATDRVMYAVLADSMRLPLEQHPRIAAMLEQTRTVDTPFADLLSVLEPSDWDAIRDELTRAQAPGKSSNFAQAQS